MEWPLVALEEAAEIRGGATPRRDNPAYWNGEIPWLTPTDLPPAAEGIAEVEKTADFITEEGLASCSASLLPPRTVLFSSRATIGKIGIAAVPLATNQGFANFLPRVGVEPRFLAWCLHFHADQIAGLAGSTTFKEVAKSSLKSFRIPLPPISEQRRIVEILDQAGHLRRLRTEADTKADRILPALFLKMFARRARVRHEKRLDELVVIGGALVDPNQDEYLDLPHVGGEQIEKDTGRIVGLRSVRESQLKSGKYVFTDQHVLYSKIRPYLNKVAHPRFAGLCSADIYPLVPKNRCVGPWFLTASLRSEEFLAYARSQSDRLRMPKLNRGQLGAYSVALPDPIEMEAFESQADRLALLEERRLNARERIDLLFELVLHRGFSGSLTSRWRDAHMKELVEEMEHQAKALVEA